MPASMPRTQLIDFLPDIYRSFLPGFFEQPMAEERHATCASCPMCPPAEPDLPPDAYFNPSTKCCTFFPALANYSVGGLLIADTGEGAEGARRVRARIAARIGVTPAGVLPPARVLLLQRASRQAFGRAESLVCPYLDRERGACTVWAHREAECATWFCKHNQGADGRAFWKQLRDYLVLVHVTLSTWTMRELGIDAERIAAGFGPRIDSLDARDLDDRPPRDDEYLAMWGHWAGREEAFYRAAFDLVRGLDRSRFEALVGIDHTIALDRLQRRHATLRSPRLPDRLVRNPALRAHVLPDGSRVFASEDAGETTRLRPELVRLLDLFDGQLTNDEVKAKVLAQTGVRVGDSFLLALYQHRILIAP